MSLSVLEQEIAEEAIVTIAVQIIRPDKSRRFGR